MKSKGNAQPSWFTRLDNAWRDIQAVQSLVSEYHEQTGHNDAYDAMVSLTDALESMSKLVEMGERIDKGVDS